MICYRSMNSYLQSTITISADMRGKELSLNFEKQVGALLLLSTFYYFLLGTLYWDIIIKTDLYCFNLIMVVAYYITIYFVSQRSFFTEKRLALIILTFNSVFVAIYNSLFFLDHGNFLSYGVADSGVYHYLAEYIAGGPIKDTLSNIPWYLGNDDKGFIVYLSFLYRCIPSNLTLNFFNVLLNLVTSICIYRLGRFMISKKGAFLAALIFGLAPYTVFYEVSGLKETVMCFLTVGSLYYLILSLKKGSLICFVLGLILCLLLVFFRVPIAFFIIISFGICFVFERHQNSMLRLPLLIIFVSIGIFFFVYFHEYVTRYMPRFYDLIMYKKEVVFKHNIVFSAAVGFIVAFFGPFATIVPLPGKENLSILAGGLILKTMIGSFFIVGVYFAYKQKSAVALALIGFCLMQIGGLLYLLEVFEFRLQFTHVGFFILVGFYGFERLKMPGVRHVKVAKHIFAGNLALAGAIYAWNILRF